MHEPRLLVTKEKKQRKGEKKIRSGIRIKIGSKQITFNVTSLYYTSMGLDVLDENML